MINLNSVSDPTMSKEQRHNAGNCDICAAVVEADAIGAIPPVGHKRESLPALAEQIAEVVRIGDQRKLHVTNLLLAFAEEIKRQAIEP